MTEEMEEYFGTAKVLNNRATRRVANLERTVSRKPLEAKANQRFNSRVSITVISYRMRLCDADGISAKAAIDGLCHCGVLQNDSPKFVKEVSYEQKKVGTQAEEQTIFRIEEVD